MKRIKRSLALGALSLHMAAPAPAASDCQPSKWGTQDEVGNANLINAASVLKAAQLIKTGQTYSLGITIDSNNSHEISHFMDYAFNWPTIVVVKSMGWH